MRRNGASKARMRALLVLAGVAGCSSQAALGSDVEAPRVTALPACSRPAGTDACIPGAALAPPVIVGPGRIRALVEDPEPDSFGKNAFRVVDIGEDHVAIVGQGSCPGGGDPESLGLTGSGETAVLCRGDETGVIIGVVDRSDGRVSWRASANLAAMSSAWSIVRVPYFADLGAGRWAFVYRLTGTSGGAAPPWMVQTTPRGPVRELCRAGYTCDPIAVFVSEGRLHVLSDQGAYSELILDGDGNLITTEPSRHAIETKGHLSQPCVAAGRDGSVTVRLPAKASTLPRGSKSAVLTLRYSHAFLPQGADVFPSEVAECAPALVEDSETPAIPQPLRRFVRATAGHQWVTAYVASQVEAPSWQQRLLDPKERYSYPGSVRVVRSSEEP
jgi:hypothetical protein